MASSKWLDRTQPQTLFLATILMYVNAGLSLLGVLFYGTTAIGLALIVGQVVGAWGIANEKKWGYWVAVAVAVLLLLLTLAFFSPAELITLIFEVALVALLLHPQSREYRRLWFR
jgi:hypothetical protein